MAFSVEADSLVLQAPAAAGAGQRCYACRRLLPAELPLLNELYNQNYQARRPLAEAAWLYGGNPAGEALIYAAFDDSGRLAGMRPAVPITLDWRGEERPAYVFADAVVAPGHRGRGIFSHLVRLITEQAEREDFTLFTIPNENSLPVYRRSDRLQVLGSTETLVRPIEWRRYFVHRLGLEERAGAPLPDAGWRDGIERGGLALRPIERFDSDFDDVHAALAQRVATFTRRRRAFLQWRYFGCAAREYRAALVSRGTETLGYVVLRMIGEVAHLVDVDVFLPPERPLASQVLDLAARWAQRMGAIAVHFNASRGNVYHAAAARAGYCFRKRSGSLVLDRRSGDLLESRQAGPLGTRDAYFVMGDFDFF
jgi:GNAT superfamily N-acetyltransferase